MKNKILLLSFLLFSLSASAQYFEVGMKWVYFVDEGENFIPSWLYSVTIIGDTTINGESAFVLESKFPVRIKYISESGQQVYYYKEDLKKHLFFDFSLVVGDTLAMEMPWCCEGDLFDSTHAIVDTVEYLNINGKDYKHQILTAKNGYHPRWDHLEGVGDMIEFFPHYPLADTWVDVSLRCVIYPNGDTLKFTEDEDCLTLVGIADIQESGLSIYPNPVMDVLTIENEAGKTYELRVYNDLGQLIFAAPNTTTQGQKIMTGDWASGAYTVMLVVGETVYTKWVVKE